MANNDQCTMVYFFLYQIKFQILLVIITEPYSISILCVRMNKLDSQLHNLHMSCESQRRIFAHLHCTYLFLLAQDLVKIQVNFTVCSSFLICNYDAPDNKSSNWLLLLVFCLYIKQY